MSALVQAIETLKNESKGRDYPLPGPDHWKENGELVSEFLGNTFGLLLSSFIKGTSILDALKAVKC